MEYNREGYYVDRDRFDQNIEPFHHEYNNDANNIYGYLLFFGVITLFVLTAYCQKGSTEDINESLLNDKTITDIKKNIVKYGSIKCVEGDICVICLEEYDKEDNILMLDCSHYYHSDCLMDWFIKNTLYSCPLCRSETI